MARAGQPAAGRVRALPAAHGRWGRALIRARAGPGSERLLGPCGLVLAIAPPPPVSCLEVPMRGQGSGPGLRGRAGGWRRPRVRSSPPGRGAGFVEVLLAGNLLRGSSGFLALLPLGESGAIPHAAGSVKIETRTGRPF